MYAPNDDANKDRVLHHLVGSDSDSDDENDDIECISISKEED